MKHPNQRPEDGPRLRNCGRLRGDIAPLLPFIRIGGLPSAGHDLWSEGKAGLFQMPDEWQFSLILPVQACLQADRRHQLLSIRDRLATPSAKGHRAAIEGLLDRAFAGSLFLPPNSSVARTLGLTFKENTFETLTNGFQYLTLVEDAEGLPVSPKAYAPFAWGSPWELLRWAWWHRSSDCGSIQWPVIQFVWEDPQTEVRPHYSQERRGLVSPKLHLTEYFQLREPAQVLPLAVRFEMTGTGWADLHLQHGTSTVNISLSDVYDPFPTLASWLGAIDRGELPIQMEIDEEGTEKRLTVHTTSNPDTVLFLVDTGDSPEVFLQGLLDLGQLRKAFKEALRTFFEGEYMPSLWSGRGQNTDGITWALELETRMLEDPILNGS
jgi:hypothetical protein